MAPPAWAFQVENFNPPPDEELICSICRCVFCEPVECPCHHVFCRGCIFKWLNVHKNCPICRKRTSESSLHPVVPIINNMIMKMTLKCHNAEAGCDSVITVEGCESHVKQCLYEPEECPNGCGKLVLRKDIVYHKQEDCPHRFIECEKCGMKIFGGRVNHDCIAALKQALRDAEKERDEYKKRAEVLKQTVEELTKARQENSAASGVDTPDGFWWSSCSDSSDISNSLRLSQRNDGSSTSSNSDSSNYMNLLTEEPDYDDFSPNCNQDSEAEDHVEDDGNDQAEGEDGSVFQHFVDTAPSVSSSSTSSDSTNSDYSDADGGPRVEEVEDDDDDAEHSHQSPEPEDESVVIIAPDSTHSSPTHSDNEQVENQSDHDESPSVQSDHESPVVQSDHEPSPCHSDHEPPLESVARRTLKRRFGSSSSFSHDCNDGCSGGRKAQRSSPREIDGEASGDGSMQVAEDQVYSDVAAYAMCSASEPDAVPSTSNGKVCSRVRAPGGDGIRSRLRQRQSKKKGSNSKSGKERNGFLKVKLSPGRCFKNTLTLLEQSVDSDPDWVPQERRHETSSSPSSSTTTSSPCLPSDNDDSELSGLETESESSYEVKVPVSTYDLLERYAMFDSGDDSDYVP